MTTRRIFGRAGARLGFRAGAILFALSSAAGAQAVPAPASEVPIPAKSETDSAAPKKDSIKPRFGRETEIAANENGPAYKWNREQLAASGALTLGDLLDRVPGMTTLRSGWIASPQLAALGGQFNRVRVFVDGLEMDNLEPRNGRSLDLTWVQLWTLDQVFMERAAGEIRVHARTWQPERTTPYTRTDVLTGDEDTNVYRGLYGKRFDRGEGLQVGAQQFSTTSPRSGGGGDGLSVLARTGVARTSWSADLTLNRTRLTRLLQRSNLELGSVPELDATATMAYGRVAIGRPASGPWAQLMAASMRVRETSPKTDAGRAPTNRVPVDTVDSARSEMQYVARVGFAARRVNFEAADRLRVMLGETYHDLSLRANGMFGPVEAGAFVERSAFRASRMDVSARFQPAGFLAVSGGISRGEQDAERGEPIASQTMRVDAGVRLFGAWLSAGFLSRDSALIDPPSAFGVSYEPVARGRDDATYVTLRGGRSDGLSFDVAATRWNDSIPFHPRMHSRAEARFHTSWLRRFPSGNFEFTAAGIHDYRSRTYFPAGEPGETSPSQVVSALVEIRIMRAVITYQLRNALGYVYEVVPGFTMPRATNIYGVRWEFWN